ncbi:hypothetical protein HK101_011025 [Irineochytrium annulatum]|nr:hypothetical protein HK101_011025 [Irineochytrium annulatum]
MSLLPKEEPETEIEVTRDDQNNINSFAKMNARMSDLEEVVDGKKKQKEDLDDLEGELELADEDELIKYRIGEAFISLSLTQCQERIQSEKEEIEGELTEIEGEMETLRAQMDGLKATLYGKFGKSINLER